MDKENGLTAQKQADDSKYESYYTEALNALRHRYKNNEVSALIGAGFSKNIYKDSPSWDELLYDMVSELYHSEIEDKIQRKKHYFQDQPMNYQDSYKEAVNEIINREGYLDVVSKYIEKKGVREAVEVYIEERMPHIDENKSTLSINNNVINLKDDDFNVHIKLLEGAWDNIYTTNYDKLLEYTANRANKRWNKITKAQELSFSKQAKSIIKLHGDLCDSQFDDFEFDGNCHHRYVISREDYVNYPSEHEAFTQLMRISLLQGTFLLMGFSGSDPNFISWIRWVRDILVLNRTKVAAANEQIDIGNIKIFLIDIASTLPSIEKQLFYKNHNIFYVPLLFPTIKKIIKAEKITDIRELIITFLSYIYDGDSQSYEQIASNDYNSMWQKLSAIYRYSNGKTIDGETIRLLYETKKLNKVVVNVHYQRNFIQNLYEKDKLTTIEIDLLLLALKDASYLLDEFPDLMPKLKNSALTERQKYLYDELIARVTTLRNPIVSTKISDDSSTYEQALRYAFTLDFTKLKSLLAAWSPQGDFCVKKAVFMSLFDRETTKNILLTYIDYAPNVSEQYYATQLLNLFGPNQYQYSTVKYENQRLVNLYEQQRLLIELVVKSEEKLKPYGVVNKVYKFGQYDSEYEDALRVLQFLIDVPLFVSYQSFTIIEPSKWYKVFTQLYKYFPYPTLFYSICSNSADVVKRIGQEYAYDDSLYKSETPKILKRILLAYCNDDTPSWIRSNLLYLSKELLIAVNPSVWERLFMCIWEHYVLKYYDKLDTRDSLSTFASSAIQHMISRKNKICVLQDCLTRVKENTSLTINFLYNLRIRKGVITQETQNVVEDFISKIADIKEFTVAGNIYPILSSNNIKTLSKKLSGFISNRADVPIMALPAICYFVQKSGIDQTPAKSAIINNRKLWGNGIHQSGASPVDYIKITSIQSRLKWRQNEICQVYAKLKDSFNTVVYSKYYKEDKDSSFFPMHYDNLFEEMQLFLQTNANVLQKKESDYEEMVSKVANELNEIRGFVNITEALVSDDDSQVVKGVKALSINIMLNGIGNNMIDVVLLIDRILFKRKEGLATCINYLAYILNTYCKEYELSDESIDKIALIVSIYNKDILQNLNIAIPAATLNFVHIATYLKQKGRNSDSINYWLDMKSSKRFNNLRQA